MTRLLIPADGRLVDLLGITLEGEPRPFIHVTVGYRRTTLRYALEGVSLAPLRWPRPSLPRHVS